MHVRNVHKWRNYIAKNLKDLQCNTQDILEGGWGLKIHKKNTDDVLYGYPLKVLTLTFCWQKKKKITREKHCTLLQQRPYLAPYFHFKQFVWWPYVFRNFYFWRHNMRKKLFLYYHINTELSTWLNLKNAFLCSVCTNTTKSRLIYVIIRCVIMHVNNECVIPT